MSAVRSVSRDVAHVVSLRGSMRRGTYCKLRYRNGGNGIYVGVVVPVKVLHKAHERNRLKRRYRPLLSKLLSSHTPLTLLCYPTANALNAPLKELRGDLVNLLHTIT